MSKACSGALLFLWRSLHMQSGRCQPCAYRCILHTFPVQRDATSSVRSCRCCQKRDAWVSAAQWTPGHGLHAGRAYHPRAAAKAEYARAALAMHRASMIEGPGDDSTCKASAGSVAYAITLYPVCKRNKDMFTLWQIKCTSESDIHYTTKKL